MSIDVYIPYLSQRIYNNSQDWGYSSVAEHLSSVLKALDLIPSIKTNEQQQQKPYEVEHINGGQSILWIIQLLNFWKLTDFEKPNDTLTFQNTHVIQK